MEIGKRKQCIQLYGVLLQSPVAHLTVPPLVLDHPENMLHPGASPITLSIEAKFQAEKLQMSQEVMQQRQEKSSAYTTFRVYYGHIGDHLRELKKKITKAADAGNRCVMFLPLCGPTEYLQTTRSMDIACRAYASRAGIHHFEVAVMLNGDTLFQESLSDLIGETV